VTSTSDFQVDAKRDATDSIRGYVYQAYQSVLAWMLLTGEEILVLEGAEDFDVHSGCEVTTTQVKDVASHVTLRSKAVVQALNNFWSCRKDNPDFNIQFRFLTTAQPGTEKGSSFGDHERGLEYWRQAESEHVDVVPLRTFLLGLKLDSDLNSFIETATDNALREELIRRIKWDLGHQPIEGLQYVIEDRLKLHGNERRVNAHYSCQALPFLLKKVADLMGTKGTKELRYGDFLSCFEDATMLSIPRGTLEEIRSHNDAELFAGNGGLDTLSRLASAPTVIEPPLPIVDRGISRTAVVASTSRLLREQHVLFISGSSGLGKTNLASLTAQQIGGVWGWVGFRGREHEETRDMLRRADIESSARGDRPCLVLDDLDVNQLSFFERDFVSLVFSVLNRDGKVIVTGQTPPPLQLLPKIWKSDNCHFTAPYFDRLEISELLRSHGLTDAEAVKERSQSIWLATQGHPQLVHAQVRRMCANGWPAITVADLIGPEDVERIRSEARIRLLNEIPTDRVRVLAYRLSLTNGTFSRATAIAIAETPPPTTLPGEAFDALVGPWIEREGVDRFRVSPLLKGSAQKMLPTGEVEAVHGQIALASVNRDSMDQYQVSTAFYHAYMGKRLDVLTSLARHMLTTTGDNLSLLSDAMRWLTTSTLIGREDTYADNPTLDYLIRLVQYRLISGSARPNNAIPVISRIEATLEAIEDLEVKRHSEAMAYVLVLNVLNVNIPPQTLIRLLSRVIDLSDEGVVFQGLDESVRQPLTNVPSIGDNSPAQVFFSYLAARIDGIGQLHELNVSLAELTEAKRQHLLRACDSKVEFASTLINRAWWTDVDKGALQVEHAIEVLELTLANSRAWQVPELTKASLVAIAVLHDEYAESAQRALDVLDEADKEFPDDAALVNQRAKILFRANRNAEALPLAVQVLEASSLSGVEFVFCCRAAGVAAAKEGDWQEAARLFSLGANRAKQSSVQKVMSVGLMADAAFALWKHQQFKSALNTFADVLDALADIPAETDIRAHHLHATLRHTIMWVHLDAQGESIEDIYEPPPGVCSIQEPHKDIENHYITDLAGVWALLTMTEQMLGIDAGLSDREAATDTGSTPLVVEGYRRTQKFKSVFEDPNVNELVPELNRLYQAMHHSKGLGEDVAPQWAAGPFPELPADYWLLPQNIQTVIHYLLVASLVSIANDPEQELPLEKWRADLIAVSGLSPEVDQLLQTLAGAAPDPTLEQQAAATLLELRRDNIEPLSLWRASFRLINAFINDPQFVEAPLEALLIPKWNHVAKHQKFRFSIPSQVCPLIESLCCNNVQGMAKVATILDATRLSLNVRLQHGAIGMIQQLLPE